jgi:hypothetical protein
MDEATTTGAPLSARTLLLAFRLLFHDQTGVWLTTAEAEALASARVCHAIKTIRS